MAKVRTRKPRLRTITIDQFDRDMLGALAAARKPGGVVVVDAKGNVRFRMSTAPPNHLAPLHAFAQ